MSMNIELGTNEQRLIEAAVRSGRYSSGTEVVADALAKMDARIRSAHDNAAQIREQVMHGLDQVAKGEVEEWDLEAAKRNARANFAAARS